MAAAVRNAKECLLVDCSGETKLPVQFVTVRRYRNFDAYFVTSATAFFDMIIHALTMHT
jgi:hypothetical protein